MDLNIALLRKSVDWAKEEAKQNRGLIPIARAARDKTHTWLQGSWGSIKLGRGWKQNIREHNSIGFGNHVVAIDPMTCGTTGCIAGHICVLNGDDYLVPRYSDIGEVVNVEYVVDAQGEVYSIKTRAMQLLGITWNEAAPLFEGTNSIDTVERVAQQIAAAHGEEL